MLKLLLMVVAAVAVSSWVGGGEVMVAAQSGGGARVVFTDELPMPELISKTRPPCVDSNNIGGDLCEEDPEYDDNIKRRVSMLMERDRGVNALLSDPSLRGLLVDGRPTLQELNRSRRDATELMTFDLSKISDSDRENLVDPEPRVNVRFGGDSETPVCSAQETLIYPKRAKTPNDEWVFVLNQEGVQQALRVEKCTSDGSACLGMVLPNGGTATCRQKHIYRRLLVLGTNKIEPEEVLMPSCCVCYTTYQDLVTRIGNSTRGRKPPSSTPPRDDPVAPSMPTSSDPVAAPVAGHAHFLPLRFNRSNRRSASVLYPFGGKR